LIFTPSGCKQLLESLHTGQNGRFNGMARARKAGFFAALNMQENVLLLMK
jgi:hypothetical protein